MIRRVGACGVRLSRDTEADLLPRGRTPAVFAVGLFNEAAVRPHIAR